MSKQIKVVVHAEESCAYSLPSNPEEFIQWWQEKFELIPEEFKEDSVVDFDIEEDYGCHQLSCQIYYYRMETDEEVTIREHKEKQAREFQENRELCELERLRNKYNI